MSWKWWWEHGQGPFSEPFPDFWDHVSVLPLSIEVANSNTMEQ